MLKSVCGFSKMGKDEKLKWLASQFEGSLQERFTKIKKYWNSDIEEQKTFDEISENTITNYYMPYSIAPNLLVNEKMYHVPMVIEESSVVAAASSGAKFWMARGGISAQVLSTKKYGQIHFLWKGESLKLQHFVERNKTQFIQEMHPLTKNMQNRGGGILSIELKDYNSQEPNYYQLEVGFETCDAMGANFINTVLESMAKIFVQSCMQEDSFSDTEKNPDILMCILTNYNPECVVRAEVRCSIEELGSFAYGDKPDVYMSAEEFAERFTQAIRITKFDVKRAVTSNKGIFNGVDAVALATGNDFRAIEAGAHAYAAREGQYQGLSYARIENNNFIFGLELPLSVGTLGGVTSLHPLAQTSLELLGRPHANELMMIMAATGLVQHFTAVRALVTTGIQRGHMQLHLLNILHQLAANKDEQSMAQKFFMGKTISFSTVRDFLNTIRNIQ